MVQAMGKTPTGERLKRITAAPNYKNGQLQNLSFTPTMAEDTNFFKVMGKMITAPSGRTPDQPLPFIQTALDALPAHDIEVIWFGHSSYLLLMAGKRILVDPVFSGHASPLPFMVKAFPGANFYQAADMPQIDVLVITHDHYDHLDHKTVLQLKEKVGHIVCSLGVGAHLEYWGYDANKITELYWYESTVVDGMQFTAVPGRHFSGRGLQRNKTLWSGFVVELNGLRVLIGGDSGYDTHFKEIGARYAGFDLVILECGQYNPAWKYIHMAPEETVLAAQELGAKQLLPVHWAKFNLSLHTWTEPADRALAEALRLNMPVAFPQIGERYVPGRATQRDIWWK